MKEEEEEKQRLEEQKRKEKQRLEEQKRKEAEERAKFDGMFSDSKQLT